MRGAEVMMNSFFRGVTKAVPQDVLDRRYLDLDSCKL